METFETYKTPIDTQLLETIKNGKNSKPMSSVDENSNSNATPSSKSSSIKKKRKTQTPQTTTTLKYQNTRRLDCDLNHSCNFSRFSTPRK